MVNPSQLQRLSIFAINALKPFAKAHPAARAPRLSSIVLSEEAHQRLRDFVRWASEHKDDLSDTLQFLWGAGLMLLGVKAARGYKGGGFDWSDVVQEVGCAQAYPQKSQEYDWIEGGCKKFLSVSLIRANHKRRVLGTMLQQAGACVVHLRELATMIRRRWSWQALAAEARGIRSEDEQVELIAQWLDENVLPSLSGGTLNTQIRQKESRYALAAALRELGLLWAYIEAGGFLRNTPKDTLEALRQADAEAAQPLIEAGPEAALSILAEMFPSSVGRQSARLDAACWQWIEGQGFGQLLFVPPANMAFDRRLPSDTLRFRLKLQGTAQRPDTLAVFERNGDLLVLRNNQRYLLPPTPLSRSCVLSAEWKDRQGMREQVLQEVALPNNPVAIFDVSNGQLVSAAPVDKQVVLVFERGLRVACEHQAFRRDPHSTQRLGVEVWRGIMPQDEVTFALTIQAEGETAGLCEQLTLSPPHLRLDIESSPRTRPLHDLRVHYYPIFANWPQWMTSEIDGGEEVIERRNLLGTWEIIHQGAYRIIAGNILSHHAPNSSDHPFGLYRVTFRRERRTRRIVFAVLPPSLSVQIERRRQDTSLQAVVQEPLSTLTLLNPQTHTQDAQIMLAPREEPYAIPFIAQTQKGVLRGSVYVVHPPMRATLFDGQDPNESVTHDTSFLPISLLKSTNSGVQISGAPRQCVKVTAGERFCVNLTLNGEGRATWRFYTLPLALRETNDPLAISVEWQGTYHAQQAFRFIPATAAKPEVQITHLSPAEDEGQSLLNISVSVVLPSAQDFPLEDISVWMVPAFAPWTPASQPPTTACVRPKHVGIQAQSSFQLRVEDTGPYMLGLTCKQRPCSGLSLAWIGPSLSPPSHLSALSKLLWTPPVPGQAHAIYTALRNQLRAIDADQRLIQPLINAISLFGPVYFRISEPLGLALSRARLRAALCTSTSQGVADTSRAYSYQLLDFVRDTLDIPWACVLVEDLQAELMAVPTSQTEVCLETLHAYQAGFLVVSVESLIRNGKLEQILSNPNAARLQVLVGQAYQWPESLCPLNEDELRYLCAPEADQDSSEAPLQALQTSPRFAGLFEARQRLIHRDDILPKLCKIKDAILRTVDAFPPTVQAQYLKQKRIPEPVQCLETSIAAITWQVHQWRTREEIPSLVRWNAQDQNQISFLSIQRLFPTLVDFWLNLWARRDIPSANNNPRTKQPNPISSTPSIAPKSPSGILIRRR